MHRGPFFRTVCLALLLLALFALRKACAKEDSFPYEAIVGNNGAAVRSGGGEKFYATNRLEPGTRVHVHRYDPDGWHMIAPPEEAFSLIPADSYEHLEGNLAEIVADGVFTRVGSTESEDIGVEQIPLRFGSRVELLPEQAAPEGWVAIQPPRGEYRWVRASELRPAGSEPSPAAAESTEESNSLFDSMRELDRQLAGLENEDPARWNLEAISMGYLRIKRSQMELAQEIDARLERIAELKQARDEYLGQPENPETAATSDPAETAPVRPMRSVEMDSFAAEPVRRTNRPARAGDEYYPTNIASLPQGNPELPTYPPDGENGPHLSGQNDVSVADVPSAEPRPVSSALAPAAPTVQTPGTVPYPVNTQPSTTPASNPTTAGGAAPRRFDAVGYVQKAVNPRPNAPGYVLVSRDGRILAYLQPPSGTSFESFIGQAMGVDGQPRRQSGLQLPSISVERLTPVRFPR